MKKIFVVGSALHYANFIENSVITSNIKEADIVLFTGGEDVNPALYEAKRHYSTHFNEKRDEEEVAIFKKIKPTQLALGICRGSQFLCVMNGGKLVQDCWGHAIGSTHGITNGEVEYEITSTHHQMQYPYNLEDKDYSVLYISSPHRSGNYKGDYIDFATMVEKGEPEIVLYHKEEMPTCLGIQGHPEYMRKESPVISMLNDLINNTLKSINK